MDPARINLALQGGGAHGAFAWGVLDRLLADPGVEIAAISGTSAGALNGAAIKAGLALGGPAGRRAARENLDHVWAEIGRVSDNRVIRWMHSMVPMPVWMDRWAELTTPVAWLDGLTRVFSPYDTGPFYRNPLAAILAGMPHPHCATDRGPRLFVAATNVRTGRIRVFADAAATHQAVLASACLPSLFRAVEIDGEAYWDGGYVANPALFPFFDPALPDDTVIVTINPQLREALPRSPADIADRVNEISFNASLIAQLRAIRFVQRLTAEGRLEGRGMQAPRVHIIRDDALMNDLSARSKRMPPPGLLARMRDAGEAAAEAFLSGAGRQSLGVGDGVDWSSLIDGGPFGVPVPAG